MKQDYNKIKKEADGLMSIEGDTKGSEFLTLYKYISQKYGEEKVELLEKEMERLGYPVLFKEIDPMKWYPEALSSLTMLTAKRLFGWKDLFEIGYNSPNFSIGVRLFIKFSSLERIIKECAKTWSKFVSVGRLEFHEFNKKEKYCVVRLWDYKFHPDICKYHAGFFLKVCEFAQKTKKMTIEETKCIYKGDPYHEYVARWE